MNLSPSVVPHTHPPKHVGAQSTSTCIPKLAFLVAHVVQEVQRKRAQTTLALPVAGVLRKVGRAAQPLLLHKNAPCRAGNQSVPCVNPGNRIQDGLVRRKIMLTLIQDVLMCCKVQGVLSKGRLLPSMKKSLKSDPLCSTSQSRKVVNSICCCKAEA